MYEEYQQLVDVFAVEPVNFYTDIWVRANSSLDKT